MQLYEVPDEIPPEDIKPGLGDQCPFFQHALKLAQHGQLEAARDTLLRSVDVDFCNPHAWAGLSDIYDEMDEPEHAAEAARQAVRSEPDNPAWYVKRGNYAAALDLGDEVEMSFGKALQFDAELETAYFGRALYRARIGQRDEAMEDLNQAIVLEPSLWDAAADMEEFDTLREREDYPERPACLTETASDAYQPNPFANIELPGTEPPSSSA